MFYEFKSSMMREFDMTDLGKMRYFLGVEVLQKTDGIYISKKKYALDVLKRFGMEESNYVHSSIVTGFKVFKDENGVNVDATFFKQMGGNDKLVAFIDSDYAGDLEDRKNTSGYVFMLSSGAVSWSSRNQLVVSLSTIEAEFIATTSCACQAVWMRRILEKLSHTQATREMRTEGNFVQPAIPRFDGHYDPWSMLMEIFLRSKEYWSLVETGYVEPESGAVLTEVQQKKLDEMKLKDLKVKNYLFQAIDRTILETI
ncbi:uncharacterized protein LOC117933243 [Vitis riparia]|uniref:uncharacterized protein LOC117933243 n=1 Tax=Vitis riparia TaxID=96939 RepID=UPI00155AE515|nr:uncharacterized protein LOC117933243 [Vitis riparia]